MASDIPADIGSADPGEELRQAAITVRQRYKRGSPAFGFWKVVAGMWDRWAERSELAVPLTPVAQAEFQAALFSARKYMELRYGGSERTSAAGPLKCATCGHTFLAPDDDVPATELSARLLGHVCPGAPRRTG